MKINIFQIILGLGIVIAMTLSIAWDPTGLYARYMVEPGNWNTVFNPDIREVIATVLAYLVILSALAIIGISITLLIKRIRSEYIENISKIKDSIQKLVIMQIGLGLLVAVSAFLVSIWGFPTSYTFSVSDNLTMGMFLNPGPKIIAAERLSGVTLLIGIISLVCGIIQYLLSRHLRKLTDAA